MKKRKIELGKTPGGLPRFLLSFNADLCASNHFIAGRLYSGYVGIQTTWHRVFSMTLWIYKPVKE